MRWTALGLLAVLLAACTGSQQACTTPICLVAHWPLNEAPGAMAVQDLVANPIFNTGTPKPGPVAAWPGFSGPSAVNGQSGGAFYFPGNGATWVEVLSTPDLNLSYGSLYLEAYVARCGVGPGLTIPSWTSGTRRAQTGTPSTWRAWARGRCGRP